MKLLVTGSTGLIGSKLIPALGADGHQVVRLVRSGPPAPDRLLWDPNRGTIDALDGMDGVIHLAGENIAAGRWTKAQKARIRDSRVNGTRLLAEALARLEAPPKMLIAASAIGYYGSRGAETLTETSPPGDDFLAHVCQAWEDAAAAAGAAGVRVVHLRFGVVLSADGGALAKMLLPFRLGLGGPIGDGQQYMSWIAIDDVVAAMVHAVGSPGLKGPVNAVAPAAVTNAEFTRTLGQVLSRPTLLPMPAFAARLLLGEMADSLLLASQRVLPRRLAESGFRFAFPVLEDALRHVLRR